MNSSIADAYLKSLLGKDLGNEQFTIALNRISEAYGSLVITDKLTGEVHHCKLVAVASESNHGIVYITAVLLAAKFWLKTISGLISSKMITCVSDEFTLKLKAIRSITKEVE
jgi:hypothetical protein